MAQSNQALENTSPESRSRKRNRNDEIGASEAATVDERTTSLHVLEKTPTAQWDIKVPTIRPSQLDESTSPDGEVSSSSYDCITTIFEKYQAVYLPQYANDGDNSIDDGSKKLLHWKDVSGIFKSLNDSDKESFCIENNNDGKISEDGVTKSNHGHSFLEDQSLSSPHNSDDCSDSNGNDNSVGYCSFLIQNDKKALSDVLDRLPVKDPVATSITNSTDADSKGWGYEPCLWIFFGRNHPENGNHKTDLQGRPEHTDQICHDGTWHYQLSGTKRWLLRPTPQLLRTWNHNPEEEPKPIAIECVEGDVLIVNTRLWRHQTMLPSQSAPSVSYARDFWMQKKSEHATHATNENGNMTNVDGLYAMDDIEEDTLIFKEDSMPDCELHRSKASNANCKVVELEDGLQAVVSARFIKAGEFFCIPESSDEEGSDDDGEDVWLEGIEEDDDDDDDDEL